MLFRSAICDLFVCGASLFFDNDARIKCATHGRIRMCGVPELYALQKRDKSHHNAPEKNLL